MSQSQESLPDDKISTPHEFIPARYFGESNLEASRIIKISPFKRIVLLTHHRAYAADFSQYQWLFRHGTPDFWYEKPSNPEYTLKGMALQPLASAMTDFAPSSTRNDPYPTALEMPRVWASGALTTPLDDDIYDCTAGHSRDGDFMGACHQCTDEKSGAIESTDLVYYLVISTSHSMERAYNGGSATAPSHGRQIYKLISCGSREAAVIEAFCAAGYGWNVIFSCVMRLGETLGEHEGKVERVDSLWKLAEMKSGGEIRVFY